MDDRIRKVERPRKAAPAVGRGERGEDADQVTAEVEVLKRAREELRLGRPARALEALVEYDRRFGRGVLGEERQAMAAIAACQATPGPAAQAQAEAFMRKAPVSPLRQRVREACITPARTNSP
jgi:outer membrane protein assembly factor BamD (BamD/ComL family)